MNYIPDYHRVTYTLDREDHRGVYRLTSCPPGLSIVPQWLRVEERRYNDSIRADLLLVGPGTYKNDAGKRAHKFLTGLRPTLQRDVYEGNTLTYHRDKKKKNLVVCRFSGDATTLVMLYFPGFYPFPSDLHPLIDRLTYRGII